MKVGIIPPFVYTIPPRGYGGEIFVWDLACGLSELGVEVHIFGVPGSEAPPNGYLHYVPEGNWFVAEQYPIRFSRSLVLSFDIIHDMTHSHFTHDFLFYRLGRHNVLSTPWGTMIMRPFCRENLVVWSRFHRKCALQQGFPESTRWVHGGVNTDFYCPGNGDKGDYFLWFARWHPSKRPDFAMQLAQQTGINLVMSGSSEESPDHQYYFNIYSKMAEGLENVKVVKMPLDSSHHQFKRELYRRARALILPYFQEAFGLVTCEALSCGTPVFGTDEGALPEIIRHGETGFLCRNDEEFVQAVRCADSLSPEKCRSDSLERWDRRRVAREYLKIYEDVANGVSF